MQYRFFTFHAAFPTGRGVATGRRDFFSSLFDIFFRHRAAHISLAGRKGHPAFSRPLSTSGSPAIDFARYGRRQMPRHDNTFLYIISYTRLRVVITPILLPLLTNALNNIDEKAIMPAPNEETFHDFSARLFSVEDMIMMTPLISPRARRLLPTQNAAKHYFRHLFTSRGSTTPAPLLLPSMRAKVPTGRGAGR